MQWPGAQPKPRKIQPVDTLKAELEEFARACAGGPAFRIRPEESVHNVAVMEAIVVSAEQGGMAPVEVAAVPRDVA